MISNPLRYIVALTCCLALSACSTLSSVFDRDLTESQRLYSLLYQYDLAQSLLEESLEQGLIPEQYVNLLIDAEDRTSGAILAYHQAYIHGLTDVRELRRIAENEVRILVRSMVMRAIESEGSNVLPRARSLLNELGER
jgi:hypothetical protein